MWLGVAGGYFAVRASAKSCPQTAFNKIAHYLFSAQACQLSFLIRSKFERIITLYINHHGLKSALITPVDRRDGAAGRCSKSYTLGFLIAEKEFANFNFIAHLYRHSGF